MLSKKLSLGVVIVVLTFLIVSCAKDETQPTPTTNNPTKITYGNFQWTYNGSTTIADSAICYLQITTLFAYKSGTLSTIELNLSDVVAGTYPVNAASGNELKFVNNGTNLSASTGTVEITNNTGSKITGNFSGKFGTSTNSITGQFSDVQFR